MCSSSRKNAVVGKCMTMCPDAEIRFRLANNMVHALEKLEEGTSESSRDIRNKMVKEYTRPAAGSDHLHPDILRPPKVLLSTVRYLLKLYENGKTKQFNLVYSFVCDRFRAVRQDMILQDVTAQETLHILEAMIPFYLETNYICRTRKCDVYDWKLHTTQMEECLSRWEEAMAVLPQDFGSSQILCAYILHGIPSSRALLDLYSWKSYLDCDTFAILRDIIIAFRSNNYIRFFRRLSELPSDAIAVAAVEAVLILRLRALSIITTSYKSPGLKIPKSTLAKWLRHNDISDLLSCFGAPCSDLVPISSIDVHIVPGEDSKRLLSKMYLSNSNTKMDGVVMISDIAWIQRGVPKKMPDKIKLDDEQMKQLIMGSVPDTSDMESDDDNTEEPKREQGIRGSAPNEETSACEDSEMPAKKDDEEPKPESGMRGIAMYASNVDDPYVTLHVDSDEEEKEEIEVKPDDNLVALAKIDRDNYTLEVYLYNEENEDWYCHHDYILDAPPLCLEPIQHDPGNDETGKGNLISIGTMEPVINIWDLDIMNSVEPVVSLGSRGKGRRKKRDGSQQGHSDAVLSLAWNRITTHVLASGGADKRIVLWDLDEAKAAQILPERDAEVQAMSWHPAEQSFMLTGTLGGVVEVIDCRDNSGSPSAVWNLGAQVEQVRWNHFNPFSAFVATDDGSLRHIDMRKPGEILWEGRAHDGSIGGLTLSATVRGLLVTVGHDQMLCVWKVQEDGSIVKVYSEIQHIGELHAAQFNPDVATVCLHWRLVERPGQVG
ncbi:WD domain, G-beta repeat protein [Cooperia oncophora]